MDADPVRIEQAVGALKTLRVIGVVPTHSTGDAGKAAFRPTFGSACLDGRVGREIGG
jgi:metal-dependent hydrolase (beta-lactamase superfamily II)